jgi:hypothetical protein
MFTLEPASYHPLLGLTEPKFVDAAKWYWVFQLAVTVLGLVIVMASEEEVVPEASPPQEEKVYCVSAVSFTVDEDTVATTEAPELYQPAPLTVP